SAATPACGAANSEEGPAMSTTEATRQIFVGGEWVDAASGETMEVLNPATEGGIAQVPSCGPEGGARAALPEWLEPTPGEGSAILLALANVLDAHAEELAELESVNVGKP